MQTGATPSGPGKRASPQRPVVDWGGSNTIVAVSGRSPAASGRLPFLATTLKPMWPGPLPRIFILTMRRPAGPAGLRHVQAVGRATQPVPLRSFSPGGMATSISAVPTALVSRKRTPSVCGVSGGTIGAGMTAMPFTLSVSSSGGGKRPETVMRGPSASVALMQGSIRSQRSSASTSGQGSVVDVVVVVGSEVLLVDVVEVDVLVVDDVVELDVMDTSAVVLVDDDVDVLVVLLVDDDEDVLDDVVELDVVDTSPVVLDDDEDVLDVVVELVLVDDVLVEDDVVLDVLLDDEVDVLVDVVDEVEVELVVVNDVLVVVVVPPDLSITIVSKTLPALSMPWSVSTSLTMRTEVYW